MLATEQAARSSVIDWARRVVAANEARAAAGRPAISLPDPTRPQDAGPVPTVGTGYSRALLDGVTLDRPASMVSTMLTNLVERITGYRDERSGKAITQVLLAGQQLVQAGLHHAARGTGFVATGSSVLGKALPVLGITTGVAQIVEGWNELQSHDLGPLSILGSRTGRSGLLNVMASALAFVPGIGTALAGAGLRIMTAANELDAFAAMDTPTIPVEQQGHDVARRVHRFDETPTNPYDRTLRGR